jgi:xanthine/uracil permease
MRDDSSEKDPKTIWQSQSTEPSRMLLEKILRQKARALRAKTRRERLGNIAGLVVVIAFAALPRLAQPPSRLQTILFALAIAWALAGQYFLNRGMWSARSPGDAALLTGIGFCRHELERQRDLFRRVIPWSFGPIVLAIGIYIFPVIKNALTNGRRLPPIIPFTVLLLAWITSFFFIRMRRQRDLQREIDELDEIEREQRA